MKKIFFPIIYIIFFMSEAKKAGKIYFKIFLNAILMILKLETISSMPKKIRSEKTFDFKFFMLYKKS